MEDAKIKSGNENSSQSSEDLNIKKNVESDNVFIKPISIIPIKKKLKALEAIPLGNGAEQEPQKSVNEKQKVEKSPSQLVTEKEIPIPYKEPPWSGLPPHKYSIEVIKNGVQIDNIPFNKPFMVVGKLSRCDILLEHPSVSRYHCVLQYRLDGTDDEAPGVYAYDLGSTHGTFQNKFKLIPNKFNRLRVGHILKFGGSTRMFILQGPDEDQEPEMEESVTELIALSNKKKLQKLEAKKEKAQQKGKEESSSDGIDWGMGEDAEEEEEEEGEDGEWGTNPYAMSEELYLHDPKKTLRGWFQREGYDLPEYQVEEMKSGQFRGKLELPIPGPGGKSYVCVVEHKGKKKDTVVQCALEACRVLDRQGLLRQATHESHEKKKKDWSENDYYDSDEDEFLDRTGDIERKRQKRKLESSADPKEKIETYESLTKQYSEVSEALDRIEKELKLVEDLKREREAAASDSSAFSDADELESYMNHLSSQLPDKHKRTAWKLELVRLRKEEVRLRKLINIVRPLGVTALAERVPKYSVPETKSDAAKRVTTQAPNLKKHEKAVALPRVHHAFLEEDEEVKPKLRKVNCDVDDDDSVQPVPYSRPQKSSNRYQELMNRARRLKEQQDIDTPVLPQKLIVKEDSRPQPEEFPTIRVTPDGASSHVKTANVESEKQEEKDDPVSEKAMQEDSLSEETEKRIKGPSLPPPEMVTFAKPSSVPSKANVKPKAPRKISKDPFAFDNQYETWVPPKGQTGDGRTALNDKLGY